MRDPRPQGREIGRARRDRDLARRRRPLGGKTDLSPFQEAYFRVGGAVVLDTLAFVVWNVGTRSPLAVIAAVRAAFRERRSLFAGIVATLVGAIFLIAGGVLLAPAIVVPDIDFVPAELFTLLVALGLEHLIGNDLRALARGPDSRPN